MARDKERRRKRRKRDESCSSSDEEVDDPRGRRRKKSSKRESSDSEDEASSSTSSSNNEEDGRRSRNKKHRHSKDSERKKRDKRKKKKTTKKKKHHRSKHGDRAKNSDSELDSEQLEEEPARTAAAIISTFPDLAGELKQLLQMIDTGQGVDIAGIPDEDLRSLLSRLFRSLRLPQIEQVYVLPDGGTPTMETLSEVLKGIPDVEPVTAAETPKEGEETTTGVIGPAERPGPKPRVIGPAMPTPDMLAAAAKLEEAEEALRQAEDELAQVPFVGPPPPAIVAEAQSTNEAERFEEVARILDPELSTPYQKLGVKYDATAEMIKKKYWKLSLMVHPDKCSHPQAQEAFTTINKAFNDLQDPNKRAQLDHTIAEKKRKEEEEADLRSLREAAQWRRMRGEIALVGDDELLGEGPKAPARDEWMTNLPPERQAGPPSMHSTFFSKSEKSGRGDTSVWTDTPLQKAEKAKMQYLEAYKQASIAAAPQADPVESQRASHLASIVDKYNERKRPEPLVAKHKREAKKTKTKRGETSKEEWVGNHPWKPWDRDKDLVAGRQQVKLDPASMGKGLASRFNSGGSQRKFL